MKVLVTGGGGFLGKAICQELLKRGHQVSSFSRNSYPELLTMGVDCIKGDLTHRDEVDEALRGHDAVIHCAALADIWGKYQDFYAVNVIGTQNLVKAMKEQAIQYLVYTSSPSVIFGNKDITGADESIAYPDKYFCSYAETKAIAEKYVIDSCDDRLYACCLRPHLIWGPGDPHIIPKLLKQARTGKLKQVGSGENLVDVIYIDNAACAHVDALERLMVSPMMKKQSFFIAQERPVRLWDFIGRILDIYEVDRELDTVAFPTAYWMGFAFEKLYSLLGINKPAPPMTRFLALQLAKDHHFSHQKAVQFFNYQVHVTIDQGFHKLENSRNKDIVKQSISSSQVLENS